MYMYMTVYTDYTYYIMTIYLISRVLSGGVGAAAGGQPLYTAPPLAPRRAAARGAALAAPGGHGGVLQRSPRHGRLAPQAAPLAEPQAPTAKHRASAWVRNAPFRRLFPLESRWKWHEMGLKAHQLEL